MSLVYERARPDGPSAIQATGATAHPEGTDQAVEVLAGADEVELEGVVEAEEEMVADVALEATTTELVRLELEAADAVEVTGAAKALPAKTTRREVRVLKSMIRIVG
jgi:hypothetical protein